MYRMNPRKDITSSLVLILFSAVFLVYTTRYPIDDWESPGPAVFPLILGGILLVLASGRLIHALLALKGSAEPAMREGRIENLKRFFRENRGEARVITLVFLLLLYLLMMQWVGFFVSTFLFIVLVSRLVENRGWGKPVALAAGVGLFCYLLFAVWIKVSFPRGILF